MIIAAFRILSGEQGVAVDQIGLTDQSQALPEERAMAGILDVAMKAAFEFIGQNTGRGTMIEGKDIEHHVRSFLKEHHMQSFRDQLEKAGITLPPQK